jgi:predicted NAD/FAD-dependent oxidoreductase
MSRYCVIGSGISGATIANLLSKNHSVDLFDKAKGPGGRSSFKRLDKAKGFDHGTQYISPKSLAFKKFVNTLIKKKILKKWYGNHLFLNKAKKENKNHLKIIGRKGNNDISKYLLKNINCYFQSELKKIDYKEKKWVLTFSDGSKKIYERINSNLSICSIIKVIKKIYKSSFH